MSNLDSLICGLLEHFPHLTPELSSLNILLLKTAKMKVPVHIAGTEQPKLRKYSQYAIQILVQLPRDK